MILLVALAGLSINYAIPKQYQYNRVVTVIELTQKQINKRCGIPVDKGQMIIACGDVNGHIVYVPNPCLAKEVNDVNTFAHLLCHEIAHTEGWVHD